MTNISYLQHSDIQHFHTDIQHPDWIWDSPSG